MKTTSTFGAFRKSFFILPLIAASALLSSCVSMRTAPSPEVKPSPPISRRPTPSPKPPTSIARASAPRSSTTHTVAPGETLWRISKVYDVPLSSIMRVNRLRNEGDLTLGQKLNIPDAKAAEQIISLYPSRKWEYIIIHHSATQEGNSLQFNEYHQSKGWDSVGYHFVIDNKESQKPDGFIEITPRWLQQLNGAHCKASEMNTKSIGICLVGNFNENKQTKAQMESLIYLVNTLKEYYGIPSSKILGHRDVEGSLTECPGKNFPWLKFKSRLK